MPSAYRGLLESAMDLRNKQTVDYQYTLPLRVAVPCGRFTAPGVMSFGPIVKAYIVCDEDADFRVDGMSGTITALTDASGRRFVAGGGHASATLFPIPNPLPVLAFDPIKQNAFSASGMLWRVYDQASKRYLIGSDGINAQAFAQMKNHFQPGYRPGGYLAPIYFPFYITRGAKLTFEFINQDCPSQDGGGDDLFHFVKISLVGKKMWTMP